MSQITNPHDAFFKQFLGKPEIAADFLTQHLPAELLALLDLSTLEEQKESFVDEELRTHFSDLLYRVKTKAGKPLYLYHLFEHKSYQDEWVAFQVLRYKMRIWEEERAKTGQISPIIAIVVYHGEDKWTTPKNFSSLFRPKKERTLEQEQVDQLLQPYLPEFSYHLVDLSALSDDEIRGEVWLQVFERILKHIFDSDLGQQLYDILVLIEELVKKPSGMQMLITLLRYVMRAGPGASQEEVRQTALKLFPTEGDVLMKTAAQEWIEEGEVIGLQKGEVIGLQKGEVIGLQKGRSKQRRTIVQILQHRFSLNEETVGNLAKQMEQIEDDDSLDLLVNESLQVLLFNDFVLRLQALLK